jgi:hypothetical protein
MNPRNGTGSRNFSRSANADASPTRHDASVESGLFALRSSGHPRFPDAKPDSVLICQTELRALGRESSGYDAQPSCRSFARNNHSAASSAVLSRRSRSTSASPQTPSPERICLRTLRLRQLRRRSRRTTGAARAGQLGPARAATKPGRFWRLLQWSGRRRVAQNGAIAALRRRVEGDVADVRFIRLLVLRLRSLGRRHVAGVGVYTGSSGGRRRP